MKRTINEKAVILARVSTMIQATDGTSLAAQAKSCKELAERKGWSVHQVYEEDGVSGGLYSTRTALQNAILDIEQGIATVFVTYAVDRSARESQILNQIRDRVLEAGGRYFLANGMEFADTPEDDLMFGTFANFAQFEKASIRRRTVGGRIDRAKEGKQPSRTFSPYGYHVVTKIDVLLGNYPAPLLGTYQTISEKAYWAKNAYHRYAAGASMRDIIRWFRDNQVLSPEGLAEWSLSSIRRMLSHPVYKGCPVFGRTKRKVDEARVGRIGGNGKPIKHVDYAVPRPEDEWIILTAEAIVPEDIWDECQRRLSVNKSKRGGNPKRKYLLGGMVVCPACGKITGGQTSNNKNRSRYYRCPFGCKWEINATLPETCTAAAVVAITERPELVRDALRAFEAKHPSGVDDALAPRLKDELVRLEKKRNAALEAELEARMDDPSSERDTRVNVYRGKLQEIAAKIEDVSRRLNAAQETGKQQQEMLTDAAKAAVAVASVREALESEHLTDVEKNQILSAVVATIKPNLNKDHVVLALRPFFYGARSETVPQILIRVMVTELTIPGERWFHKCEIGNFSRLCGASGG